jgi:hypothetical protein
MNVTDVYVAEDIRVPIPNINIVHDSQNSQNSLTFTINNGDNDLVVSFVSLLANDESILVESN